MRQVLHPHDPQPFGANAMTIMRKLDRGERPAFTRMDAPAAMRELVARCLSHDPSQRPVSMWEVHNELKGILQQLLRGVAHVHACGLMHRDLKPDNVLITGEGVVKLADFGHAGPLIDRDLQD